MSGGSWDYLFGRMDDAADRLVVSSDPRRKAFGLLMRRCAKAMHDIEWVDSGDCGPGDDADAIDAALRGINTADLIRAYRDESLELVEKLNAMLALSEDGK
jgi:hypothetical protein